MREVATLAHFSELKVTASIALRILIDIQVWMHNKQYHHISYLILLSPIDNHWGEQKSIPGDDLGGLILSIWRSSKNAETIQDWLSVETKELLDDLTQYDKLITPL